MVYPQVLPGNEFKIQKELHLLTNAVVRNFAVGKRVKVAFVQDEEILDKRFDWRGSYKKRVWGQQAEIAAHSFEKGLHNKLSRMVGQKVFRSHAAANEYFAIWCAKSSLAHQPLEDGELNGVLPDFSAGLKQDQRSLELLESRGISSFVESGGRTIFRGIDQTHPAMMMHFDRMCKGLDGIKWQLLISQGAEFVAPMSAPRTRALIPISPGLMLACVGKNAPHKPIEISDEDVFEINRTIVADERDWVIARSESALQQLFLWE